MEVEVVIVGQDPVDSQQPFNSLQSAQKERGSLSSYGAKY